MPSGKVTVTVAPGSSEVPVIGSVAFAGSIDGAFGAMPSTVSLSSGDSLPAASVTVALISSPSFRPGFVTVHVLSGCTTAVAVVPSGKVTVTVAPGSSDVPVIGSVAFAGSIDGALGAAVSTSKLITGDLLLSFPLTVCVALIAYVPSANGVIGVIDHSPFASATVEPNATGFVPS